jgi:purine nucleoside permease
MIGYAISPLLLFLCCFLFTTWANASHTYGGWGTGHKPNTIRPKVVIVGFYSDEGSVWHDIPEFDVLQRNVTVPGLSAYFDPVVHCTKDGAVCQLLAGEGGKASVLLLPIRLMLSL